MKVKKVEKMQTPGTRNPHQLPAKICPACGKAFTWRKKWERDWEQVIYCSGRCKRSKVSGKTVGS